MHTIAAHPAFIGFCIASYIALVTLVGRYLWPKPVSPPAPVWKVWLHFVVIDWPASLPAKNAEAKGLTFKIGDTVISAPFLSWSEILAGPPPENITKRQVITPPPLPPARGDQTPIGPRKEKGYADEDWLAWLAAFTFVVLCAAICCIGCGTPATIARKTITGIDAVDGAAARIGRTWLARCHADAKALGLDTKKFAEADAKYGTCESIGSTMAKVTVGVEDATQIAADGVDAGEKLGQKDYGGVLGPALAAVNDLIILFAHQGLTLPAAPAGGK